YPHTTVQYFERLFGAGTVSGLSEWQLLSRYLTKRDELAFEAIVARHGPMVLAVCRRLLNDPHDVDDAFQATFLVLVRKAGSLGPHDALGHWLYGVAYRVSLRARSLAARRHTRERSGGETLASVAAPEEPAWNELKPILDDELNRLPDRYRKPLVLCYLEGLTHEEAAQALAWPLGTVKGRLARAREQLRLRLSRRGVALSGGVLAACLERATLAAVPAALLDSTVKAATALAAGPAVAAGVISAAVAVLLEGVLRTMSFTKFKLGAATLITAGVVAAGATLVVGQVQQVAPENPATGKVVEKKTQQPAAPVTHYDAIKAAAPIASVGQGSGQSQRADSPRSKVVLENLEKTFPFAFPDETALGDVLKYVKAASQGPDGSGIPIYVDPIALKEAEVTLQSPIQMDLEGVPLKTTLRLMLAQLGLKYRVEEGVLIVCAIGEGATFQERIRAAQQGELNAPLLKELVEDLKQFREFEKLRSELEPILPGNTEHILQADPPKRPESPARRAVEPVAPEPPADVKAKTVQ
ncbi:MAG TPA: RNA polymerase sigma factor, partial [Isosphaeraceae bacterium]|nr:RNA polymerase sigma factor [Isosphaeraceae bacterium]